MDNVKIGMLIFSLRKEKGMTQKQLAKELNISDKTVSKWERGQGLPDISLMPELSRIFGIDIEKILEGDVRTNDITGGNMKKSKYYVCPHCGNIALSTNDISVSCCGRKLEEAELKKADDSEKLKIEKIENEYFISSDHPMTKDHYISFIAAVTGDSIHIIKKYPEWDFQCRIGGFRHGMIVWYCVKHGLFYQNI